MVAVNLGTGECLPVGALGWVQAGASLFVVHLPNPEELPLSLRIKFFRDHDTFAAYLRVWVDLGYSLTWPGSHTVVIGSTQ